MRNILLIFYFLSSFSFALTEQENYEMHELRLAKAELALNDKSKKKALELLDKNISSEYFHLNTYLFISELQSKEGKHSKSFQTLRKAIIRSHGKYIIDLPYSEIFNQELQKINPPTDESLGLYFLMAEKYFNLYAEGVFSEKYGTDLLGFSEKYLKVCLFYNFRAGDSTYYLGIIQNKRGEREESLETLTLAEKMLKKEGALKNKKKLENIDFIKGSSLIEKGYIDAGNALLAKLYLSPSVSPAIKDYSKSYIDGLFVNFHSFSAALSYKYNSNIFELNSNERTLQKNAQNSVPLDSTYFNKSFHYSYFSPKFFDSHLSFSLNYEDELQPRGDLYTAEYQAIYGGLDLKKEDILGGIGKASYQYTLISTKDSELSSFSPYEHIHNFSFSILYPLYSSFLTILAPFEIIKDNKNEQTFSKGLSLSYIPYTKTKKISTNFSLGYNQINLAERYSESNPIHQYLGSLSGKITLEKYSHFVALASYEINYHQNPAHTSAEFYLEGSASYIAPWAKDLIISSTLNRRILTPLNKSAIVTWEIILGISYVFI